MDQRNLISSIFFFLLGTCVLMTSLGLGIGSLNNPQPGFMPFWISVLIIIFSLILFGIAYIHRSVRVRWKDLWHQIHWKINLVAVTAVLLYILFLPLAGYLIATGVLMLILFKLGAMKTWTALLGAILSVGFTYGLFYFLLKTPLPRSIWGF